MILFLKVIFEPPSNTDAHFKIASSTLLNSCKMTLFVRKLMTSFLFFWCLKCLFGAASPISTSPKNNSLIIAACTVVRNEVPYLPEWIEHYRLNGFQKFWIFDDNSSDNPHLLGKLYKQVFPMSNYVEVFQHHHPGQQSPAYSHCHNMALKDGIDWVAVIDVDEFWISRTHLTLLEHVQYFGDDIGVITVPQVRFGTSGQLHRHQFSLVENASGKINLINEEGIQLLLKSHQRRGPYKILGEPAELISSSLSNCSVPASGPDAWPLCHTDILDHKSMWRPQAVLVDHGINPHDPNKIRDNYKHVNVNVFELRGNHYYFRSVEDAAKKSIDWKKPDPIEGVERVSQYWNSIHDGDILSFVPEIESNMKKLMQN